MKDTLKIIDREENSIYLTMERWKHIVHEHPELSGRIEDIKLTIINSFLIRESKYDPKVRFFYRYYKQEGKYLLVAVKYLRDKGFIITAFFVRSLVK